MLQDFTSEEDESLKHCFWVIPEWISLILWYILDRYNKKLSVYIAFSYAMISLMMVNLSFRNKLSEDYFNKDVDKHDDLIYVLVLYTLVINYNDFMVSLVLYPVSILVLYYF
jgi:hypothetical protein